MLLTLLGLLFLLVFLIVPKFLDFFLIVFLILLKIRNSLTSFSVLDAAKNPLNSFSFILYHCSFSHRVENVTSEQQPGTKGRQTTRHSFAFLSRRERP